MSLQNSVAAYTISIQRDGNGAIEANQQLTALNQTFDKTAAASARASSGFRELNQASSATKASLRELHSVGLLVGSQMAPEVSIGLMTVTASMRSISAISKVTGASIAGVGVVLAGFVATIYTAVSARKQLDDVMKINFGAGPSTGSVQGALKAQIDALVLEGKLMKENAESMKALLNPTGNNDKDRANNFWVMNALRSVQGTQQEEEAANRIRALHQQMLEDGLDAISKERFAATSAYDQRIREIDELGRKAGTRYNQEKADIDKELAKEALSYQLAAIAQKQAEEEKRKEKELTAQDAQQLNQEISAFERGLTIQSLTLSTDRITQANREFTARTDYYTYLAQVGAVTEDKLTQLQQEAQIKRLELLKKEEDHLKLHIKSIGEMETEAANSFASGFASAFGEFATGTKSAGQAFREFAVSFLRGIAEMILETEILAIVRAIAGIASGSSGGGGAVSSAGTGSQGFVGVPYAAGGVVFAASGLAGVSSVSSATYLPRFNVVAGEAGREMLTVLARPRMMEVGGVQSVVGQAGRHTLAISNASDLGARPSSGAASGNLHIHITHSEDSKAEIISTSIKGAVLTVTKEAQQSGSLRKALKSVTK